jgi:hypothetical protein
LYLEQTIIVLCDVISAVAEFMLVSRADDNSVV